MLTDTASWSSPPHTAARRRSAPSISRTSPSSRTSTRAALAARRAVSAAVAVITPPTLAGPAGPFMVGGPQSPAPQLSPCANPSGSAGVVGGTGVSVAVAGRHEGDVAHQLGGVVLGRAVVGAEGHQVGEARTDAVDGGQRRLLVERPADLAEGVLEEEELVADAEGDRLGVVAARCVPRGGHDLQTGLLLVVLGEGRVVGAGKVLGGKPSDPLAPDHLLLRKVARQRGEPARRVEAVLGVVELAVGLLLPLEDQDARLVDPGRPVEEDDVVDPLRAELEHGVRHRRAGGPEVAVAGRHGDVLDGDVVDADGRQGGVYTGGYAVLVVALVPGDHPDLRPRREVALLGEPLYRDPVASVDREPGLVDVLGVFLEGGCRLGEEGLVEADGAFLRSALVPDRLAGGEDKRLVVLRPLGARPLLDLGGALGLAAVGVPDDVDLAVVHAAVGVDVGDHRVGLALHVARVGPGRPDGGVLGGRVGVVERADVDRGRGDARTVAGRRSPAPAVFSRAGAAAPSRAALGAAACRPAGRARPPAADGRSTRAAADRARADAAKTPRAGRPRRRGAGSPQTALHGAARYAEAARPTAGERPLFGQRNRRTARGKEHRRDRRHRRQPQHPSPRATRAQACAAARSGLCAGPPLEPHFGQNARPPSGPGASSGSLKPPHSDGGAARNEPCAGCPARAGRLASWRCRGFVTIFARSAPPRQLLGPGRSSPRPAARAGMAMGTRATITPVWARRALLSTRSSWLCRIRRRTRSGATVGINTTICSGRLRRSRST